MCGMENAIEEILRALQQDGTDLGNIFEDAMREEQYDQS